MHDHVCPACLRPFQHQAFTYLDRWSPLERIVARALHRFCGGCLGCIMNFLDNDFRQDKEPGKLELEIEILKGHR